MLAYVESADERDRDDLHGCEEDRPVIVQLKPTDLGADEVNAIVERDNIEHESAFCGICF
jgi:hypothetical protein